MTEVRYALVGAGSRATMFINALRGPFAGRHELVALLDCNPQRLRYLNETCVAASGHGAVPTYAPNDLRRMLDEQRVDTVIVASVDRTHHTYIIAALEAGRDVITEKPMTIDAEKCAAVLEAVKRTGRALRVTFNYRYGPRNAQIRELLASGIIGEVFSVHFEWLLDTSHGADYFRRWHRDKLNSGGLMVHKATHHFDLVNWWLGSHPRTVFGFGGLRFYGKSNAEARGVSAPYVRYTGEQAAASDPFATNLSLTDWDRQMYLNAERYDGYQRDQNVFGQGVSIEDDMSLVVRFRSGATMTYHLTAYSPYEGVRIAFNGSKGRLEYDAEESQWVSSKVATCEPACERYDVLEGDRTRLTLRPHWGKPREIPLAGADGPHGGGDERMLQDIFEPGAADPLKRAANHVDGAWSILTGIAANQSFASGVPVHVEDLIPERLLEAPHDRSA